MSPPDLTGRLAVITGGDRGIGAACAKALAYAGADIGLVVLEDGAAARKVAAHIIARGRRVEIACADVGSESEVDKAFSRVGDALGCADILINSAGLNMNGTVVADMELEQWERLLRTDLTGSFLTCRRFIRDRRGRGGAATIINITSIHAFAMRAGGADYTVAKGGQDNLTRTLALECAPAGVTVNAIAPGFIATDMNAGEEDHAREVVPLRRAGEAAEIGQVATFLASPAAAYITGATLVVDGGLSLLMGQGA